MSLLAVWRMGVNWDMGGTFFLSFYNLGMVFVAHIVLHLLIPGEDVDFGNVGGEEAV